MVFYRSTLIYIPVESRTGTETRAGAGVVVEAEKLAGVEVKMLLSLVKASLSRLSLLIGARL